MNQIAKALEDKLEQREIGIVFILQVWMVEVLDFKSTRRNLKLTANFSIMF
jgi:hypothetical protein